MSTISDGAIAAGIRPILYVFEANDKLIRQTLSDLPPDAYWQRPTANGNPIMWLVGHITQSRAGFLSMLVGEQVDTGWGDLFKRGASVQDAQAYPAPQVIKATGIDVATRLRARLASLTDEELARSVAPSKLPGVNTLGDALSFFVFHEAYHVGQLGYVKKALGYAAIADA